MQSLAQADSTAVLVLLVLLLLVIVLAVLALWLGLALGRRSGRLEAERRYRGEETAARGDAVRRSRAVLTGQIGEQLAPYFPAFPCDPADARFLGKPVDFIAFSGASEGLVREGVFIEVKSGDARLSATERALKEAVEAGRVRWVEYRLPLGGKNGNGRS
ncbi:MAG: hypothetical protein A2Y38_26150 [Spirochaetes bacterium GWB1_59_5]|nr:MAG: hypothetical protein A2Y38_26150 [Spirochaetes bacterium GWB1_59_5]